MGDIKRFDSVAKEITRKDEINRYRDWHLEDNAAKSIRHGRGRLVEGAANLN